MPLKRMPEQGQPYFERYIGIDYSGAQTADSSLKGLRVYEAMHTGIPMEQVPQPGQRKKHWTRRALAQWLGERLASAIPTLVGIDHCFSFPWRYFEVHHLAPNWPAFLDDFQQHWPTDGEHTSVDFVRHGICGNGAARSGNSRWRRCTEQRAGAKSVFHFDVPGSVAKSSHAGLPWLRYLRQIRGQHVHFWPFDGWEIPPGKSALGEIYPSLWNTNYPRHNRTADQHDAYVAAAWMQQADRQGQLKQFLHPAGLSPDEDDLARVEGWILGVT